MCRLDDARPPNSLSALRACLAAGVEALEVDICALREGQFLVAHGPELSEATTGRGPASAIDAAAARALRIKGWDEPPPLLSDLLPELEGRGLLQLDLKEPAPLPSAALDALAAQLRPRAASLILSGGSAENVLAIGDRCPELRLGFDPLDLFDLRRGVYVGPLAPPDRPAHLSPSAIEVAFEQSWRAMPRASIWYLRATFLTRLADDGFDAVGWLRARGVREVDAWTIDLPPEDAPNRPAAVALLRRSAALGVTQMTTNTPLAWLAAG
jgi:glycerophosphoryl diester phosphodiesterase